jgi:hypothetical protein
MSTVLGPDVWGLRCASGMGDVLAAATPAPAVIVRAENGFPLKPLKSEFHWLPSLPNSL